MVFSMRHADHRAQLNRLKRIEGQARGLIRMVEERRHCLEILVQVRALRAALKKVEIQVLHEHVEHCVAGAMKSTKRAEREEAIAELLEAIGKFDD